MIREAIQKVVESKDLNRKEAREVMSEIMSGAATPAQIAAFITALRMKGETIDEITGCAEAMREKATTLDIRRNTLVNIDREDINIDSETILDTCGTGGDGTNTFNISTTTAFVVAGAGVTVAKHGNRSVSSQCGSADVVQALGVNIDIPPERVKQCVERVGIGFMFAPLFHSAMKHAIGPRREIGVRTIFNVLGPLTNPAHANVQVLGVYKSELTAVMAKVLLNLGARAAMVVHGEDSYDEITITGETRISELKNGKIRTYNIKPEDFGMKRATLRSIKGGDAARNAEIVRSALGGAKGAKRDIVLLNAAAALVVAGRAKNLKNGIELAAQSIDTGSALRKLELLILESNRG
jgi:anthranilate phosphoribosyltransferase